MFKNYFITAFRNIIKGNGYTALNVFGLAIGMSVALLVGLWVVHEYSYDKFLSGYKQLYKVQRNFDNNGEILTFSSTSLKLAETLRSQVPEIEYVVESDYMNAHGLMVGDKKILSNGGIAGGDFFKMFSFPFLKGNAQASLKDPYSIVLTESTALALFGKEDPVNKMVRFDNHDNLKVTGIIKDIPLNSSLSFQFIVPFSLLDQTNAEIKEMRAGSFGNNNFQQFVQLRKGASIEKVLGKIKNIEKTETNNINAMKSEVILQPFANIHLYGNYENGVEVGGFVEYVKMFSIIGLLVLLIACINFINLTTARSEKRAKEVGIRKAIGSLRKDLILQFLIESTLLAFISFIVCLLLVQLVLPYFNTLTGSDIVIPFSNPLFWLIALGGILVVSLLAGSRPAFYLSSFKPVKTLKGALHLGRNASIPRKILVVLQFSCSVALIISTIIVYQQIQYAKKRPTGYTLNRLMITGINTDLEKNYTALRNDLIREGLVDNMTTASSPATGIYWHADIDNWPGKYAGETVEMGIMKVDAEYFKTMGMQVTSGRDFTEGTDTNTVIFNEAAVKRLRLQRPLSQSVTWNDKSLRIVGVARDALMISPFTSADPTMFIYSPDRQYNLMYSVSARFKTEEALARISDIFNKYSHAFPYEYQFADQEYAKKFNLELLIGKLAGILAALAIFISCLGLFGLAAYIAEQRTKEIGIRKVLGASVSQVWFLLSKDFIALVLLSCLIASPVALYFLQEWLIKYTYRISIGAGVFLWATAIAVIITLITISFQSVKAALMNPVKSLRSE